MQHQDELTQAMLPRGSNLDQTARTFFLRRQAFVQVCGPNRKSSFLFLVATPFVASSFLLLVARPGATSSVVAPSSNALCYYFFVCLFRSLVSLAG